MPTITNVPSFEFLAFVALAAIVINLSAAAGWRRAVLLVANIVFFLTLGLVVGGFLKRRQANPKKVPAQTQT